MNKIEKLKQQRDDLLSALQDAALYEAGKGNAHAQARAVISKILRENESVDSRGNSN